MDKYQLYADKTIQLFLEGELKEHNVSTMSMIVFRILSTWIDDNMEKIQVDKLRYFEKRIMLCKGYVLCNCCNKLV